MAPITLVDREDHGQPAATIDEPHGVLQRLTCIVFGDLLEAAVSFDAAIEQTRLKERSLLRQRHIHVSEPRFQQMLERAIAEAVVVAAGFIEQMALAIKTPADYGVDTKRRLETLKVTEPPKRQAGEKVGSVDELVGKLKALGVVQ